MSIILAAVLAVVFVGLDQIFKYLAIEFLSPVASVELIPGVIRLRYIENTGAIFGSFSAHTAVLTAVSVVLLGITVYYLITKKSGSKLIDFCLVLMISGGIGNIIDRIRLHFVVDYIEPVFVNFAVFNFADCLITTGAFAMVIYLIVGLFREEKVKKLKAGEVEDGEPEQQDCFDSDGDETSHTDSDGNDESAEETDGEF